MANRRSERFTLNQAAAIVFACRTLYCDDKMLEGDIVEDEGGYDYVALSEGAWVSKGSQWSSWCIPISVAKNLIQGYDDLIT